MKIKKRYLVRLIMLFTLLFFFTAGILFTLPAYSQNMLSGPSEESPRAVSLTFDDGPSADYTPAILDILSEYEIVATFFVLGRQLEKHTDLVERIIDEGHEIGNHSYSHPSFRWLSVAEAVENEVKKTDELIRKISGKKPRLFRPPFGEITSEQKKKLIEIGYTIVRWSLDTRDWNSKYNDVETMLVRVSRLLHPGAIILMHDGGGNRANTVALLPDLIELLWERGYSMNTVSEFSDCK